MLNCYFKFLFLLFLCSFLAFSPVSTPLAQNPGTIACGLCCAGPNCTNPGNCQVNLVCDKASGWADSYCMLSNNVNFCKASGTAWPLWEPCCKVPTITSTPSPTPTPTVISSSTPTPTSNPRLTASKPIAFFYNWPSNLGSTPQIASQRFAGYNAVVFGECLEKESHAAHNFTKDLITLLRGQNKEVFGYIDFGVRHWDQNELQKRVNSWKQMGATGIFWDDFSKDYVNTARQAPFNPSVCEGTFEPIWNSAVLENNLIFALSAAHNSSLKAFINLWNWDEKLDNGYSIFSLLNSGDLVLAESLILSRGSVFSSQQFDKRIWWVNNILSNYPGIKKACLSTFKESNPPSAPVIINPDDPLYKLAVAGALISDCDYSGITDNWHSAGDSNTLVDYQIPSDLRGVVFTGFVSGNDGVYQRNSNLGILKINIVSLSTAGYWLIPNTTISPFCLPCPAGMPLKTQGNSNCDGKINSIDFALWKKVFINPASSEAEKAAVDFNCQSAQTTHEVNIEDFNIWSQNYY